jgi:hypothetical protein
MPSLVGLLFQPFPTRFHVQAYFPLFPSDPPSFIHQFQSRNFKQDGFSGQLLITSSIFNSRVSCLFFRFSYLSVIFPSSCEIPRAKTCCCNFMVYKKSQQVLRSELIDVLGMNSITTSTRREVIFGKSRNFTKNTVKLSLS